MNKAAIIASILGVAVVGGGVYIMSSPTAEEPNQDQATARDENTSRDLQGTGTFLSLIERGDDLTCNISYTAETGAVMEGDVFFSNGNMRGDFTMEVEGERMETHIIHDGEYGYTWGMTPLGTMAMKFSIDDAGADADEVADEEDEQFNLDQQVVYECSTWRADASKFVPPSDIEFVDFEAQMNAMFEGSAGGASNQCAACEQIPDQSAKAQCLVALGCS